MGDGDGLGLRVGLGVATTAGMIVGEPPGQVASIEARAVHSAAVTVSDHAFLIPIQSAAYAHQ